MNKRFYYIIILILTYNCFSYPQSDISFFGVFSYNTFSMSELKSEQNELFNDIRNGNIPAKITESYPAYFGFKVCMLIKLKEYEKGKLSIGGIIQHQSTGGRIHYQDYSGELRADQHAKSTGIGALLNYQIDKGDDFSLGFNISVNYFFSAFNNTLLLKVGDLVQKEEPSFSSTSIGIEPELIPSVLVWKLHLGLSLSYLFYFPSKLELDGYDGAYLVNKSGEYVNINWSGFRIGLFTSISL